MDYILTKMNEQTWMIDNNGTRIFILEGQERTMVIDSGMTLPETRQIAGSLSDKPLMLCNTHADIDHISGNDAFDTVYMHPSELVFYNHTGKHTHRIKALYEGDVIDLGDRKVEIIEIPGHTCGCIAFLDRIEPRRPEKDRGVRVLLKAERALQGELVLALGLEA